jgi:hypothetical protein
MRRAADQAKKPSVEIRITSINEGFIARRTFRGARQKHAQRAGL